MNWILIIALFLSAGSGLLQAKPLWNAAESGLQPEQVLKQFAGAVAVSKEPPEGGEVEKVRIPSHKYLGREFSVHFFFSKEGLQHVRLVLDDAGSRAEVEKLVDEIIADLSKVWGKPKRSGNDHMMARTVVATWSAPDLEVSVMGLSYTPLGKFVDPASIAINYRKLVEKEKEEKRE